jgi:hypothetical protein
LKPGLALAASLKTFAAALKSEAREEVQETMLKYNQLIDLVPPRQISYYARSILIFFAASSFSGAATLGVFGPET